MTNSGRVTIPCGRLALEGYLHRPRHPDPKGGAVVCHPHPLYGGNMDHPVVVALAENLSAAGFLALRLNFRGVGRSQGGHGGGGPEREDVTAALDWVGDTLRPDACLVLGGYSFGAWVAYPVACADPRVTVVLCVAPPLELLPMPEVRHSETACWFGVGERDEYCSPQAFRDWYKTQGVPKEHLTLPGADHFLGGREDEVAAAAAGFAAAQLDLGRT